MSTDGQGMPVSPAPKGPNLNPIVQTIWRGVEVHVLNDPDTHVRSLVFDLPTNQVVVPMIPEIAERLGRALSAPSVYVPRNGEGTR